MKFDSNHLMCCRNVKEETFFSDMGEEATYNNFKDAMEELMYGMLTIKFERILLYKIWNKS